MKTQILITLVFLIISYSCFLINCKQLRNSKKLQIFYTYLNKAKNEIQKLKKIEFNNFPKKY